jgi:menaquinone-dependent protoporphyrinogen oxidase
MQRKVLVAYASRHGSTEGIARRIAATLQVRNVDATAMPIEDIKDVGGYDGYVIGSAVYALHWLGEAKRFAHRHRAFLRRHPVWLFSSGPLTNDPAEQVDAAPRDIADVASEVDARGHQVFAGAWHRDVEPIGAMEKVMSLIPAARTALPDGDFRDWAAIDAFALAIAGEVELALQSE